VQKEKLLNDLKIIIHLGLNILEIQYKSGKKQIDKRYRKRKFFENFKLILSYVKKKWGNEIDKVCIIFN
jgi:hypothetical protein